MSQNNQILFPTQSAGSGTCALNLSVDKNLENNVSIYPNPTSNIVKVESLDHHIIELNLLNISGQIIRSKQNLNFKTTILNLDQLNKGIYILSLRTSKGLITKKIIKE